MVKAGMMAMIGLASGLAVSVVQAGDVAGVQLPATRTVGDTELQLNGAGVRRKFFVKVYVGALYLPSRAADPAAILSQSGPRLVTMHVLYGEISAAKLVDGWNDGFAANLDESQLAELQPRIDQFDALFETVRQGDVIMLDYLPGQGTGVTIRGKLKGRVPGRDFNDALLRIWLGDEPADAGLKEAMLGG